MVSQFTLFADTIAAAGRGSRAGAARPPTGSTSGRGTALRELDVRVETGRFGAEMAVELVNDGPFTIWLDTDDPTRTGAVGDNDRTRSSGLAVSGRVAAVVPLERWRCRRRPTTRSGLEQRPPAAGADSALPGRGRACAR